MRGEQIPNDHLNQHIFFLNNFYMELHNTVALRHFTLKASNTTLTLFLQVIIKFEMQNGKVFKDGVFILSCQNIVI